MSLAPSSPRGLSRPWMARAKSLAIFSRACVSSLAAPASNAAHACGQRLFQRPQVGLVFSEGARAAPRSRRGGQTSSSGVQWNRAASRR